LLYSAFDYKCIFTECNASFLKKESIPAQIVWTLKKYRYLAVNIEINW